MRHLIFGTVLSFLGSIAAAQDKIGDWLIIRDGANISLGSIQATPARCQDNPPILMLHCNPDGMTFAVLNHCNLALVPGINMLPTSFDGGEFNPFLWTQDPSGAFFGYTGAVQTLAFALFLVEHSRMSVQVFSQTNGADQFDFGLAGLREAILGSEIGCSLQEVFQ